MEFIDLENPFLTEGSQSASSGAYLRNTKNDASVIVYPDGRVEIWSPSSLNIYSQRDISILSKGSIKIGAQQDISMFSGSNIIETALSEKIEKALKITEMAKEVNINELSEEL